MRETDPTGSYLEEVAGLAGAYKATLGKTLLSAARELLRGKTAFFVASGGASPAAELAAGLHTSVTGSTGMALSPLAFLETRTLPPESVLVILSARARHPDTALAANHARGRNIPVILVTQRNQEDLTGALHAAKVTVVTVPSIRAKDGFLATQSVIAMSTALIELYEQPLPKAYLPLPQPPRIGTDGPVLVLHARDGKPAATDIEIRFHELGLGSIEVADFRNFAHGRHVGLSRRQARMSILALTTPESKPLADRTLSLLPDDVRIHRIAATENGPAGALQLLGSAMGLPANAAREQQISPDSPSVPGFGRELYHLPFRSLYPAPRERAVARKLASLTASPSPQIQGAVLQAYQEWRTWTREQTIRALVLDYDGTLVSTSGRFAKPRSDLREKLITLMEAGLLLGFATGRGDSLIDALRQWVPPSLQPQILLGLHNGAWESRLDVPADEPTLSAEWIPQLMDALGPLLRTQAFDVRVGSTQLSLWPLGIGASLDQVRGAVMSVIEATGITARVASSGHSVDVIDIQHGKGKFFRRFEGVYGTAVAVGDQGNVGGNDFSLLAATRLSVSVDRCSPDLDRCWNIAREGKSGPEALLEVLNLIRSSSKGFRLQPKNDDNGQR